METVPEEYEPGGGGVEGARAGEGWHRRRTDGGGVVSDKDKLEPGGRY